MKQLASELASGKEVFFAGTDRDHARLVAPRGRPRSVTRVVKAVDASCGDETAYFRMFPGLYFVSSVGLKRCSASNNKKAISGSRFLSCWFSSSSRKRS